MTPWRATVALFALAAAALAGGAWWRARAAASPAALLSALPGETAVLVYADLGALRASGILDRIAGPAAAQDPEYRDFVQATGFDYRRDLDAAAVALAESANFFVLRGRFALARLRAYAHQQGGSCVGDRCEMPASEGRRRIAFRPFGDGLAIAVSAEPHDLDLIAPGARAARLEPAAPLWIAAPGAALRRWNGTPLAQVLAQAERSEFALAASGGQLELRLAVACAGEDAARSLAAELTSATALLKRQNPPAAELAGMLAQGVYAAHGPVAEGRWPVAQAFLDNLLGAAP